MTSFNRFNIFGKMPSFRLSRVRFIQRLRNHKMGECLTLSNFERFFIPLVVPSWFPGQIETQPPPTLAPQ
jgi:hypothetical protein